jgi:hypothetical protein
MKSDLNVKSVSDIANETHRMRKGRNVDFLADWAKFCKPNWVKQTASLIAPVTEG